MSIEALRWFDRVARQTETAAEYVVLHMLCAQEPRNKPGSWFKPNLSEIERRTPVKRPTASKLVRKLAALDLLEHRPAKSQRMKGSIRLRLDNDFSNVIEGGSDDPDCNQRLQRGVTKGYGQLSSEMTESVTSEHTTHIQEQATGGATPEPEPVACSTEGTSMKPPGSSRISKRAANEIVRDFMKQTGQA